MNENQNEKFPRLTPQQLPEPLATELCAIEQRVGYLNDIFLIQGHVPQSITAFMAYTQAVKAPLSDRYNQLIALTTCQHLDAKAELIQHERLSVRLGLPLEWIAAAEGREGSDSNVLTAEERQIQQVVRDLVTRLGNGCEAALTELATTLSAAQAVAVLLQTTRFIAIAVMCRAFNLEVPVKSVFAAAD